ncbi:uncharacterized protein ARMOST_02494 [Armillaria ostoyae]|uniref:Uncharacterized protein n=1 Tax=Armillaria ostoyae TaxID=47428 RepID=A0A284QS16_ARMOS|nr:uncharacterized protein ARMOST_02494 [Armillaria ostoyae]
MAHLVHGIALDLGKYGITVNAYVPGALNTEMSDAFHFCDLRVSVLIIVLGRETAHQQGNMEEVIKLNVARSAVHYVGQPEVIAGLVFLFSFERSALYNWANRGNGGWCFH